MKQNYLASCCGAVLCISLMLNGCASDSPTQYTLANGNAESLSGLQAIRIKETAQADKNGVSKMRAKALKETALSIGAQSALASRGQTIEKILARNEDSIGHVFDFSAMMLFQHVLPPVLVEANESLKLNGTNALRLTDHTYRIVSQARFVTTPPTWREYLSMDYATPDLPHKSLLPHTNAEQKLWKAFVTEGWEHGLRQADTIFEENLARLKRDYIGMARYRRLLAQHMVSPPFVAQSKLGITGDKDQLHINDRVLRITALPQLSQKSENWSPVLTP